MYVYTSYRYYGQITWTRDCIRHFSGLSLSLSLSPFAITPVFFHAGAARFYFVTFLVAASSPPPANVGDLGNELPLNTSSWHLGWIIWNLEHSGTIWNHLESTFQYYLQGHWLWMGRVSQREVLRTVCPEATRNNFREQTFTPNQLE